MSSKRLRSGRCPGQGEQHRVCRLVVVRARFVWRKLQRLAILLVGVPRPARQRFRSTQLAIAHRPAKVDPNRPL